MTRFLTETEQEIQSTVRRFAEKELRPRRLEGYKGHDFSREMYKRCGELGFLGARVPEQFGGTGLTTTAACVIVEELGRESAAVAIPALVTITMAPGFLGAPGAAERFLPGVLAGDLVVATGWSDPSGVCNFGEQPEFAVRDGDDYLVSGSKLWVSNGTFFDVMFVVGLFEGALRGFIMDRNTPGLSVSPIDKMGCGAPMGLVTFDKCRVPSNQTVDFSAIVRNRVIDPHGAAGLVSMLYISCIALGGATRAWELTYDYLCQRTRNKVPIASMQGIQHKMVKMKSNLEAGRSMLYDAARLQDQGRLDNVLAHLVKPWVTEMSCDIVRDCMTLHGGAGYAFDNGIEGYMRDTLGTLIGENTAEMHYSTVSFLMGFPGAEPSSV